MLFSYYILYHRILPIPILFSYDISLESECLNGAWPSGKVPGFGPAIRGFESFRPT